MFLLKIKKYLHIFFLILFLAITQCIPASANDRLSIKDCNSKDFFIRSDTIYHSEQEGVFNNEPPFCSEDIINMKLSGQLSTGQNVFMTVEYVFAHSQIHIQYIQRLRVFAKEFLANDIKEEKEYIYYKDPVEHLNRTMEGVGITIKKAIITIESIPIPQKKPRFYKNGA